MLSLLVRLGAPGRRARCWRATRWRATCARSSRCETPGTPVTAERGGVLIMNLKSGGGKAERFDLETEARRVGVEQVVLPPG